MSMVLPIERALNGYEIANLLIDMPPKLIINKKIANDIVRGIYKFNSKIDLVTVDNGNYVDVKFEW